LSLTTKTLKFLAVENLYQCCKAFDFVKEHPWPGSGANMQAGLIGEAAQKAKTKPKTPIIPNEVLIPLCKFTKSCLDRADEILASKGKRESLLLRDSCIFWLLLTTGMRIHEVLGIKRGAYRSETRDEVTYYYIETTSEKTHTGLAEWIAPEIATQAIDILGRYSEPLQKQLETDLSKARDSQDHLEVHRLEEISDHICLSTSKTAIALLSGRTITVNRLPNLCQQIDTNWNLSAHQFRRTFANYAVHSELGDLRALKDHFKHWSITMTALYAFNEDLDAELFEELLREKYLIEEEIKQDWFELDTPITGGDMAENIKKVRADGELIKTFGSLGDMAKAYSSSIPIRSTGIGWCTNDDECKCGKPDSCESGIVDKRHLPYWEGMLVQQMKLMQLDDIGEAGRDAARKGMERCEKVLSALGIDVEAMKQKFSQRDLIEVENV
ncbi:site-specific integrase, partial [Vibrio anguillarum]